MLEITDLPSSGKDLKKTGIVNLSYNTRSYRQKYLKNEQTKVFKVYSNKNACHDPKPDHT